MILQNKNTRKNDIIHNRFYTNLYKKEMNDVDIYENFFDFLEDNLYIEFENPDNEFYYEYEEEKHIHKKLDEILKFKINVDGTIDELLASIFYEIYNSKSIYNLFELSINNNKEFNFIIEYMIKYCNQKYSNAKIYDTDNIYTNNQLIDIIKITYIHINKLSNEISNIYKKDFKMNKRYIDYYIMQKQRIEEINKENVSTLEITEIKQNNNINILKFIGRQ